MLITLINSQFISKLIPTLLMIRLIPLLHFLLLILTVMKLIPLITFLVIFQLSLLDLHFLLLQVRFLIPPDLHQCPEHSFVDSPIKSFLFLYQLLMLLT